MKTFVTSALLAAMLVTGVATAASAQTVTDTQVPGHPRINEVDQRLQNQQNRIDQGVANGQINAKQEARDEARDAKVSQELSADEAKHNGHITKAEQNKMNRQLNRNSEKIKDQREGETK
jgi:opacity protein-like surface antigen